MFFGLKPPAALAQAMFRSLQLQPDANGRFHAAEDLHITLVFLGNVAETAKVLSCIEGVEAQAFRLSLDRLDYWPKPKILLLRPSLTPDALKGLVRTLQQRLTGCGFTPDSRSYRPHLTLARKARPIGVDQPPEPLEWLVEDFCLFVSDWAGPAPHYRVIGRWLLEKDPGQS